MSDNHLKNNNFYFNENNMINIEEINEVNPILDYGKENETILNNNVKNFNSTKILKEHQDIPDFETILKQCDEIDSIKKKQKRNQKNRCALCNCKLKITDIECRCEFKYCMKHRMPENHKCNVDYKEIAKQKIKKENPLVINEKIIKI